MPENKIAKLEKMKSVHYSIVDEERNFVPKMRASMPDLRDSVKKSRHSSTDIINRLSQHRKSYQEKTSKTTLTPVIRTDSDTPIDA